MQRDRGATNRGLRGCRWKSSSSARSSLFAVVFLVLVLAPVLMATVVAAVVEVDVDVDVDNKVGIAAAAVAKKRKVNPPSKRSST